ncbi:MAG: hypothetical protein AB8G22_22830 [Saprospiraceae bacterium]
MLSSISDIQDYFHQRALKHAKQQLRVKHNSMNLQQAKHIGILFNATTLEQRKLVLQYVSKLEKQGKKVTLLGFLDQPKSLENLTFPHYSKQEINWKLEPHSTEVVEFIQKKFDILLVLDTLSNLQFEYISTLSKATFRVGPFTGNIDAYDLMIDTNQTSSLTVFIQQIEQYLQKTTTLHEQSTI